jgi:hypothetical protein
MAENEFRTKRAPRLVYPRRQSSCEKQRVFHQENSILDLISMGEPLPAVLNNLCAAIDLQVGNVITVVSLADEQEHNLQAVTQGALRFGLHVFWSGSVALPDGDRLGSLEAYCCVSRTPTPLDLQLFDRAAYLAALAIRRHHDKKDFEDFYTDWKSPLRSGPHDVSHLN